MSDQTYAVRYGYVPDMDSRREPHRADHLGFLRARGEQGDLVLAGALTDPVDGAWLVVRAASEQAAYALVSEDPYVKAGLVRSITVRSIVLVVPG
ncbi:MAG TPA: YciI family protein [Nocardioidaceae bacterium]|nr:YciI family protein [Nocardioidaceae bacterium]